MEASRTRWRGAPRLRHQISSVLWLLALASLAVFPGGSSGCRVRPTPQTVDENDNGSGREGSELGDAAEIDTNGQVHPEPCLDLNDNQVGGGNENRNVADNSNANDGDDGEDDDVPLLTFAVIGDYGADSAETLAVSRLMRSWDPDLIITTGDNDYSDGYFKDTYYGLEYGVGQYFHDYIGNYVGWSGEGSPVNRFFPTPGNHDWGGGCDDPTGLDDYLRYFTLPDENSGNERYYDFTWGPVHFFSIHSVPGCEPDGTTADSAQARWVRDTALTSTAKWKIAYFHNPPYSSGEVHVGGGVHMRWPWAEWGFHVTMSGDDHVYERVERDGFTYLVNGLGGVVRHDFVSPPDEGSLVRFNEEFGALKVTVFDSRLEFAFITMYGVVVDEFTIHAAE